MNTIEERAAVTWESYPCWEDTLRRDCFTDGFIAGAISERKELLRWRDPNVEVPKDGEEVLVKADCPYCRYDVMKHDAFGWWEKTSLAGGGWYKAEVEITGWRPIQEE